MEDGPMCCAGGSPYDRKYHRGEWQTVHYDELIPEDCPLLKEEITVKLIKK